MNKGVKTAPISGGIGISYLRVYTTKAPDGLAGGCPHMHFACTESYAVLEGRGRVQILGYEGYREVPLQPGTLLWYTPGIIHRLVNEDGNLKLLVIMQNAGLPEAGDHVLSFPFDILADREAYYRHASLADAEGRVYASDAEAAFKRRDLAVTGFLQIRERYEKEGAKVMEEFFNLGAELLHDKIPDWRAVWEGKILKGTCKVTENHLNAMESFRLSHLKQGHAFSLPSPVTPERFGFCGWLSPYDLEGTKCYL
jgi:mannose-6-phosphate isomerase-like protein (cupin superfamily)